MDDTKSQAIGDVKVLSHDLGKDREDKLAEMLRNFAFQATDGVLIDPHLKGFVVVKQDSAADTRLRLKSRIGNAMPVNSFVFEGVTYCRYIESPTDC